MITPSKFRGLKYLQEFWKILLENFGILAIQIGFIGFLRAIILGQRQFMILSTGNAETYMKIYEDF